MQKKFTRLVKEESGMDIGSSKTSKGDPVKSIEDLGLFHGEDLPLSVEGLEGTERGYVALMAWANQQRREAGAAMRDATPAALPGTARQTAADDLAALTAKTPTEATPNLTRFLANSQVKEPVFHAAKADVKEFSPKYRTELSSMGFHFGTADQANFRTGQYDFDSKSPNIGKYYLNIENPLEVSHMASFAPDHLAEKMMDMDLLTEDAYDVLSAKNDYDAIATGDSLVKILKKNGYDGLKYKNEREGEGFSFVPFNPTQIKSAIGNEGTFDPANPVITKAQGGYVTKKTKGA
jgi:hypothetical protein